MSDRKQVRAIHKHEEFQKECFFENSAVTLGFSVNINEIKKEHLAIEDEFRSDYMIICMVTCGEITLKINLKKYHLETNGLIVAAPNALKQFVSASPDCSISIVSFTADFLNKVGIPNLTPELFEYFSTKYAPHWALDQQSADLMKNLMVQLHQRNNALNVHSFGKELLYNTFKIFIYEIAGLSETYAEPVTNHLSRKENLVMEFFQVVQKNFKHQRSVKMYADQLNITPKYLTETVKEISGKNAGEIIDDVVMLEARYLLNNPSLSIAQTADLLHFNDQSFFGKFFKRHTGVSPREYRNALTSNFH